MFFGNPAYKKIKDSTIENIQKQFDREPLYGPLEIVITTDVRKANWFTEWLRGTWIEKFVGGDVDNILSTVFDLLKDAKVVFDDTQFVKASIEKHFDRSIEGAYRTEIKIFAYEKGINF